MIFSKLFKKKTKQKWVPRQSRVQVQVLHDIAFEMTDPKNISNIKTSNLSTGGVGFLIKSSTFWPSPGEQVSGQFEIKGNQYKSTQVIPLHQKSSICYLQNVTTFSNFQYFTMI